MIGLFFVFCLNKLRRSKPKTKIPNDNKAILNNPIKTLCSTFIHECIHGFLDNQNTRDIAKDSKEVQTFRTFLSQNQKMNKVDLSILYKFF